MPNEICWHLNTVKDQGNQYLLCSKLSVVLVRLTVKLVGLVFDGLTNYSVFDILLYFSIKRCNNTLNTVHFVKYIVRLGLLQS